MKNSFEGLESFSSLYDSKNEQQEKKEGLLIEKQEQIEEFVTQLKKNKRDLERELRNSYLNPRLDSAGILMDIEVVNKKLELNEVLLDKLFN